MGISSARGGTEAGSNSPDRPENVEIDQVQWRQVPTVRVPYVLHKDKFVDRRTVTYRQVHTDSKRPESRGSPHVQFFIRKKFLNFDAGANDTKRHRNLWKFTERIVYVPVVQREQIQ